MDAIARCLHDLWEGERELGAEFGGLSERFPRERAIAAAARVLADYSAAHAALIAELVDVRCPPPRPTTDRTGLGPVRTVPVAPVPGRTRAPSALLLHELRRLHLLAYDNLLGWEALCCAAPEIPDRVLLDLAAVCRPRTLAQVRWTRTAARARWTALLVGRSVPGRRQQAVLDPLAHLRDPGSTVLAAAPLPDADGAPDAVPGALSAARADRA